MSLIPFVPPGEGCGGQRRWVQRLALSRQKSTLSPEVTLPGHHRSFQAAAGGKRRQVRGGGRGWLLESGRRSARDAHRFPPRPQARSVRLSPGLTASAPTAALSGPMTAGVGAERAPGSQTANSRPVRATYHLGQPLPVRSPLQKTRWTLPPPWSFRKLKRVGSQGLQPSSGKRAALGWTRAPGWPWPDDCLSRRGPPSGEAGSARATAPRPGDSTITLSRGVRPEGYSCAATAPRGAAWGWGWGTRSSPSSLLQKWKVAPHVLQPKERRLKEERGLPHRTPRRGSGWAGSSRPASKARASGGAGRRGPARTQRDFRRGRWWWWGSLFLHPQTEPGN